MTKEYSIACTEVLEILKYLPREEKERIPEDEIEFYEENKSIDYKFRFNPKKPIEDQEISKMANAIILTIFRDYFASEEQRMLLSEILKENVIKVETKRHEKYESEKSFDKKEKITAVPKPAVIKKKKSFLQKVLDTIKKFIRR